MRSPSQKAGASLITFHLECGCDTAATLARIKALGCKTGLSVKPHTSVQALFPYLDQLDLALVMSVEPGFGGQKFMPMALDKIHALREEIDRRGLSCLVEVDGGVDAVTGPLPAWRPARMCWWPAARCSARPTLPPPWRG